MANPHPRTILITGASTGLGLAIARLLMKGPDRLVLTARTASMPRFATVGVVEGPKIWLRALDVTNQGQREALIDEINRDWGGVDVLVNNAGVSYRAVVEHVQDRDRLAQMAVNFLAPMELARLVLPSMRAKRRGHIVNISSVGGMMAMPTMAVYSASKFALEGASEALWYEVKPWGVHVSLIEPGFIHSEGFEKVRYTVLSKESDLEVSDPYHAHYEHMAPFVARMMAFSRATPERVAKTVARTINRRKPPLRVPGTFDARLFAWLRRMLPRGIYHGLLYRSLPKVRHWGPKSPGLKGADPKAAALRGPDLKAPPGTDP